MSLSTTSHVLDVLARSVLFVGSPPEALYDAARRLRPIRVGPGTVVCREGQLGDEMYIIEDGRFLVEAVVAGKPMQLAELGPGTVFGEMAVVTGQPRSATVSALTHADIWALSRQDFQALVRLYPQLGAAVEQILTARQSDSARSRLANEKQTLLSFADGQETVTIGRVEGNDIVVSDPGVSRVHARIDRTGDQYQITDLQSTNGTYVNGERIQTVVLRNGDHISVGSNTFIFDRSEIARYSRGGGIKVDAVDLTKVVGAGVTILNGVSLSIHPGQFVCIVGGSGAGKSTLLNSLSGLSPATSGRVLYNGIDLYRHVDLYRQTLGFVPQDDIVHLELTVYETLYYVARLRLPGDTSRAEIEQRIDAVMADLELHERRNTQVRRLSGGQRKRVSIGVELLTQPQIFYLDEPTSGLDPSLDSRMMDLLRKLADQGRTVLTTTHATRNIMICDMVVFMARGGRLAFYGPPRDALTFFGVEDFVQIYELTQADPEGCQQRFLESELYQRNVLQRLEAGATAPSSNGTDQRPPQKPTNRTSTLAQLIWLTVRYFRILLRDPLSISVLLAAAPIVAAVYTLIYSRSVFAQTWEAGGDARNALGLLFNMLNALMFLGAFVGARAIAEEISIFRRERLVNLKLLPYTLSKLFVLGLFMVVQAGLMLGITALNVDFPGGTETLLRTYGILVLVGLAAIGLGLQISAMCSNGLQAAVITVVLLIPQGALAGANIPINQIKEAARALSLLMMSRWGVSLLGHTLDMNPRLEAQYPFNDFADQFTVEPLRAVLIIVGLLALSIIAAIVVLQRRGER